MGKEKDKEIVNVLVGCGGSGIRTLMRVNELLSEDPSLRRDAYKHFYYIVADTNRDEISEFQRAVERDLPSGQRPGIYPFYLAQDLVTIGPLVRQYFITPFGPRSSGDPKGKERLYSHWWHRADMDPFTAHRVSPLSEGAGQCPPASYFLTWWGLDKFGSILDDLMQDIKLKAADSVLKGNINLWIVGSLAGGTGRGCWSTLAFKIRERFLAQGWQPPAPMAVLFDASVFENDVFPAHPDQELPMRVNSLTGVSELSCWIRNAIGGADGEEPLRYEYRLPNMRRPESKEQDSLRVDLAVSAWDMTLSPVNNAFLVFSQGDVTVLDDSTQYFGMAGTVLYGQISNSRFGGELINYGQPYLSFAAATAEVNASTLRLYCEAKYRVHAVRHLKRQDRDAAVKRAGAVLAKKGLQLGTTVGRSWLEANSRGTVLQQAAERLVSSYKRDFDHLDASLERDDPEEVSGAAAVFMRARANLAAEAIRGAFEGKDGSPEQAVRSEIVDIVKQTKSVDVAVTFLEAVRAHIEGQMDRMPPPAKGAVTKDENPMTYVDGAASRERFGLLGRHFNDVEAQQIRDRCRRAVVCSNYPDLRDALEACYKGLLRKVEVWLNRARCLSGALERVEEKFRDDDVRKVVGAIGGEMGDVHQALFTDPDHPEAGIVKSAGGRFVRRTLRPVMSEEQFESELPPVELDSDMRDFLTNGILGGGPEGGPLAGLDPSDKDAIQSLKAQMEKLIRQSVHLPGSYIRDKFSLRRVLDDHRKAWGRRFNEVGSAAELLNLAQAFQSVFGTDPRKEGDQYVLPDVDSLLISMAASLARTCRPYWQLNGTEPVKSSVGVLLPPASGAAADVAQVQNALAEESGRRRDRPGQRGGRKRLRPPHHRHQSVHSACLRR